MEARIKNTINEGIMKIVIDTTALEDMDEAAKTADIQDLEQKSLAGDIPAKIELRALRRQAKLNL